MPQKSINDLINNAGLDKERLPRTIYTQTPEKEDSYGYKKLVETIFSHLYYRPLDSLRIHEEVIEPSKQALLKKICGDDRRGEEEAHSGEGRDNKKEGRFTWPVLISRSLKEEIRKGLLLGNFAWDQFRGTTITPDTLDDSKDGNSHIVLDGTHRTVSLREVGSEKRVKKIPVLDFDYYDDCVELSHWCRLTPSHSLEKHREPLQALVERGILVELEGQTPLDIEEENPIPLISCDGKCYTFREYHSIPQEQFPPINRDYELSKEYLELDTGSEKEKTSYLGFEQAKAFIDTPGNIVVFPRKLSKMDVIRIVWESRVFPRKTTRHVFSFRVFNLPLKLSLLCDEKSSLQEDLKAFVREKVVTLHLQYLGHNIHLPEDGDRYYEEHMFKFTWEESDHAGH